MSFGVLFGVFIAHACVTDGWADLAVVDNGRPIATIVLPDNPTPVEQYRSGKKQVMAFLVGQVMKRSQGRAEPKQVRDLLHSALSSELGESAPSG